MNLEKHIVIKPKDNQMNIPLRFHLDKGYDRLVISFQYGPAYATDEEAIPLILNYLPHYFPLGTEITEDVARKYLPLENLVTLSLAYNGSYLGARHTKERDFKIEITPDAASLGFPAHDIKAGEWEIQLNVHCIASKQLDAKISIQAEGGSSHEPIRCRIAQPHSS